MKGIPGIIGMGLLVTFAHTAAYGQEEETPPLAPEATSDSEAEEDVPVTEEEKAPLQPQQPAEEESEEPLDETGDEGDIEEEGRPLAYRPLREIRAEKRYGASLRYGLFVAPVQGFGIDGFYQLREDWQLGLVHLNGTIDLKNQLSSTDGTTTEKHQLGATLSMAYARWFFSDSFYLTGGIGRRIVQAKYKLRSTTHASAIQATNTTTSNVAHIAVGNMWTWQKGFFAGVDWLGYTHPFSSNDNADATITGSDAPPATLEAKRKDIEDNFDDVANIATKLFLTFHFGYTF